MKHKGYNNVIIGTHHPYGYNGKEENEELGLNWIDYGAGNYQNDHTVLEIDATGFLG